MSLFFYSLQTLSFFPVSFCFECRLKHLSLTENFQFISTISVNVNVMSIPIMDLYMFIAI